MTATDLLDSSGAPVQIDGKTVQPPEAFSPAFFFQRGREDAKRYAEAVRIWQSSKDASRLPLILPAAELAAAFIARIADEASLKKTPVANFGRAALWDAQRYHSSHANLEFRDATTIYIGIYAAAAGLPEEMIQEVQNYYALVYQSQFKDLEMDKIYEYLPKQNVENLNRGYQLVRDGRIN